MKRFGYTKLFALVLVLLMGCIDPYNPPEVQQANSLLVVDGYVDMRSGTASITLSRTKNLSESNEIVVQSGAQVSILVEGGATYLLPEGEAGVYSVTGIELSEANRCQLRIESSGKTYESELVSIKTTPEIDSVTYVADDSGVKIEVTTHDPANETWYYQWHYEETAKYMSSFRSNYYYRGPNDYPLRTPENDVYVCWKTNPSTSILIGTSSNLEEDVIYKHPLTFIPSDSWMLEYRYSILVRQFAIDEATFNYWTQIKKNTESLGSLFDPQPSQVTGNIRCLDDPSVPVLGYFSARSIREKRIFIDARDLPDYRIIDGYERCFFEEMDTILLPELAMEGLIPGSLLVIPVTAPMGTTIIGYLYYSESCLDCRYAHQGTTKRPEWWEE